MTLPAWPTDLPRPMRPSWSAQAQDPRQKRAAETGPPGYRRRYSNTARTVALEIDVTRHGKSVFERFVEEDIGDGTLPFTMPDPTTDGWALLDSAGNPMLDGSGTPILLAATWVCLMGDQMPVETISAGVRFRIGFFVSVMP
jgi:hypothetical protein